MRRANQLLARRLGLGKKSRRRASTDGLGVARRCLSSTPGCSSFLWASLKHSLGVTLAPFIVTQKFFAQVKSMMRVPRLDITPAHLGFICIGLVIGFVGLFAWHQSREDLEAWARIAPLGTATIAFVAASIALWAMFVQRKDTARRRAALDFFLKTETDDMLINAYNTFNEIAPRIPVLISDPTFSTQHRDYKKLRKWLNIC